MKKILVVSTSLRKDGNSDLLADEFQRGAVESGHDVEKINLLNKNIGFCKGCLACQSTKKCVIQDDANAIVEEMLHADVLVLATPIYFYEMCGQMKTLLDRTNPLFSADYSFRDIYLLAAVADSDPAAIDGAVNGLQGWLDCFEKTRLMGIVRGVGVTKPGEISTLDSILQETYQMGKNIK